MREPGQPSAAEGPAWALLSGKSPRPTHQPQSMGVVPPGHGYDAEVAWEQGRRCCGCCSVDHSEGAFASSVRGRAVSQNLDGPRPRGSMEKLSDFRGVRLNLSNFYSNEGSEDSK